MNFDWLFGLIPSIVATVVWLIRLEGKVKLNTYQLHENEKALESISDDSKESIKEFKKAIEKINQAFNDLNTTMKLIQQSMDGMRVEIDRLRDNS